LVSAPTSPAPVLSEPDSAPAPITPVLTGSRRNAPHAVIAGVHARAATAEAPSAPEPQARAAPSLSLQNLLAQAGDYATQQNETHSATSNGRLVYGASARGLLWSQYFDDWVRRMERAGAVNFPQNIRSLGLSGGPTLSVVINADGSLASLRIVRSSGNPVLDQATNDFVRSMAPFAPFPPPLAQQGSSVEFQRKWTFSTNNDASVP
jgi:protein TonB